MTQRYLAHVRRNAEGSCAIHGLDEPVRRVESRTGSRLCVIGRHGSKIGALLFRWA